MRILVDADACPVVRQTERLARVYRVPLLLFCDTNHQLFSAVGEVVVVSRSKIPMMSRSFRT